MVLLMAFAVVAGAATAITPCVLPVLPVVLSAGATGGRRRPLGIVAGLVASFTLATVGLVYVIAALGLPDDLLRTVAIGVLLAFGAALLVPAAGARLEGWLSRLTGRGRVARPPGAGFWPGVLVGASLGMVYTPCAGPILAGVITVSASQPFTAGRLAVAASYAVGSAGALYALMLGGRRVIAPLARRGRGVQLATGAVMVAVALAMLGDLDLRFESAIAAHVPSFLVNPTRQLESGAGTRRALARLSPGEHRSVVGGRGGAVQRGGRSLRLPVLGPAPDFTGNQRWFNTPGGRPLTLRALRGRVVLVDFWTYTCINCIRTLPYLEAWDARYRARGLTIVGVHTPEFPFERDAANVGAFISGHGIRYPVAQDNERATWDAYGNQYWPAEYFIDARGRVRYAYFGEGADGLKERVIRTLLAEAGRRLPGGDARVSAIAASPQVSTPESYLGSARAERFIDAPIRPGVRDFGEPATPPADHLAFRGRWRIGAAAATSLGGAVDVAFGARRVYLVLGSPGAARRVRVLLDGHPPAPAAAGADVRRGALRVRAQRLYELIDLPAVQHHHLRVVLPRGVSAYAFTFG